MVWTDAQMDTTVPCQHGQGIDALLQIFQPSIHDHGWVRRQRRRIEATHIDGTRGVGRVGEHVKRALAEKSESA